MPNFFNRPSPLERRTPAPTRAETENIIERSRGEEEREFEKFAESEEPSQQRQPQTPPCQEQHPRRASA